LCLAWYRRGRESWKVVDALSSEGLSECIRVAGASSGASSTERLCEGVERVLGVEFPHLDAFGLFVDDGLEGVVL
jgi:hypothetical protein